MSLQRVIMDIFATFFWYKIDLHSCRATHCKAGVTAIVTTSMAFALRRVYCARAMLKISKKKKQAKQFCLLVQSKLLVTSACAFRTGDYTKTI